MRSALFPPPVRVLADPWIAPAGRAVALPADADLAAYEAAGATGWLAEVDLGDGRADVRAVIRNGPWAR
ncbi:hypothetical protein [Pseudonocardia xishanensis]|uniref:Uncharacterized protein n=1 Tax=Pseudonocardia xishanensis TaxID=630995 RepID=A0ABP8RQ78_9PSEU